MRPLKLIIFILLLISAACQAVVPVQPVKVEGTAMLPALKDGDRVIIDRQFDKIERGDIIIFLFPRDQTRSYLKRVIGLPHETVEIREGQIFVNGRVLDEPYVDPRFNQSARSLQPIKLPEDNYFVVGDNRDNSSDSRFWGPVERKLIYGKYIKTYMSGGS